jgi:hypothetical protein
LIPSGSPCSGSTRPLDEGGAHRRVADVGVKPLCLALGTDPLEHVGGDVRPSCPLVCEVHAATVKPQMPGAKPNQPLSVTCKASPLVSTRGGAFLAFYAQIDLR